MNEFDDLIPKAPTENGQMEGPLRLPAMAVSNATKGALGTVGIPGDFLGMVNRNLDEYLMNRPELLMSSAINYAQGKGFQPSEDAMQRVQKARAYWAKPHMLGSESLQGAAKAANIVDRPDLAPQTTGERYFAKASEGAGAAGPLIPFSAPGMGLNTLMTGISGALGGEGGGDLASKAGYEEGTLPNTAARAAGSLAGGVAGSAATAGVQRALAMRQAEKAVPTSQALRTAADNAYQTADDAGLVVSQPFMEKLGQEVTRTANEAGFHPKIHPKVAGAVESIMGAANGEASLQQIDQLRRIAGSAARSIEPDERRVAATIINKIDDMLNNLGMKDVMAGNADEAASALQTARGLWSTMRKTDLIQEAVDSAKLRAASTGSGGNVENAIRQNIRRLLESEDARGFTAAERAALRQVVEGTPSQNALRLIGKFSPQGSGLMAALSLGATAANPWMAVAPAAGMAAKAASDRSVMNNVNLADLMVRNRGPIFPGGNPPSAQLGLSGLLALTQPEIRSGLLAAPAATRP